MFANPFSRRTRRRVMRIGKVGRPTSLRLIGMSSRFRGYAKIDKSQKLNEIKMSNFILLAVVVVIAGLVWRATSS